MIRDIFEVMNRNIIHLSQREKKAARNIKSDTLNYSALFSIHINSTVVRKDKMYINKIFLIQKACQLNTEVHSRSNHKI